MSTWQTLLICVTLVVCVLICADAYIVTQGIDGALWYHRTPAELAIQQSKIGCNP